MTSSTCSERGNLTELPSFDIQVRSMIGTAFANSEVGAMGWHVTRAIGFSYEKSTKSIQKLWRVQSCHRVLFLLHCHRLIFQYIFTCMSWYGREFHKGFDPVSKGLENHWPSDWLPQRRARNTSRIGTIETQQQLRRKLFFAAFAAVCSSQNAQHGRTLHETCLSVFTSYHSLLRNRLMTSDISML